MDDAASPRVARVAMDDFHLIAGDVFADGAWAAVAGVPKGDYIAVPEGWHELVRRRADVEARNRFAFWEPEAWDCERLAEMRESLAPGFTLHRIDAGTIAGYEALERSLIANFRTHEYFLERGVGFGIKDDATGEFVAGCASYAIGSRSLEFEIQTREDYWRRGLALVTGARMIEHCIENGLEACWDAAHAGSADLAERLGFVGRRGYVGYQVRD